MRETRRDHPFARNTFRSNAGLADPSASPRLQTEKSFEIEQVTDIRDIDPEWDDEDIDVRTL